MKSILFSTALLLTTILTASAQLSSIRMEVTQVQKTESSGKQKEIKSQKRSLDITLHNMSRVDNNNLVAKYWFFSKNLKSGDVGILVHGERKIAVPAGKKETSNSEQANAVHTESHFAGDGKGGGKKVEASGEKMAGYAVKLMDGEKVLQEVYNPPGMKEKLAAAPAAKDKPAAPAPGAK